LQLNLAEARFVLPEYQFFVPSAEAFPDYMTAANGVLDL